MNQCNRPPSNFFMMNVHSSNYFLYLEMNPSIQCNATPSFQMCLYITHYTKLLNKLAVKLKMQKKWYSFDVWCILKWTLDHPRKMSNKTHGVEMNLHWQCILSSKWKWFTLFKIEKKYSVSYNQPTKFLKYCILTRYVHLKHDYDFHKKNWKLNTILYCSCSKRKCCK